MRRLLMLVIPCVCVLIAGRADAGPFPEYDRFVADCQTFWLEWNHRNARAREESDQTTLLVAPQKGRILEIDSSGKTVAALNLPQSKHWKALHISAQRIAELPLPFRVRWVHSSKGLEEWITLTCLDTHERKPYGKIRFSLKYGPQVAGPGGFGMVPSTIQYTIRKPSVGASDAVRSMLTGIEKDAINYRETSQLGPTTVLLQRPD